MINLSRHINDHTPNYIVDIIIEIVKNIGNPVVSIFGLVFKGNIDDVRESPNLYIIDKLLKKNIKVKSFDPLVKIKFDHKVETLEETLTNSDCIILLTDHDIFNELDFNCYKQHLRNKFILDTRKLLDKNKMESNGFNLYLLGSNVKI